MNPFFASIIFIIVFFFISIIKQTIFPTSSQTKLQQVSEINIQKVIQLSPNSQSKQNSRKITYNSLYQAYYGKSASNSYYNYSFPQNFTLFNHSILQQSMETQKKDYICGNDYMIQIWRGMRSNKSGNAQWINFIQLYKLPYLQKLDSMTIFGRTRLPILCKNHKTPGRYQLGIVNQNRPTLITFNETGKLSLHTNLLQYLDQYSLEISVFDYTTNFWAYISREEPWIVKIAQKSFENKHNVQPSWLMKQQKNNFGGKSGLYQTNTFLQIDMLDIELSRMNKSTVNQIISIKHLFIKYLNNKLYLTCVYAYFSREQKLRKIVQASFKIHSQTLSLLSHFDLYTEIPSGQEITTQCSLFSSLDNKSLSSRQIINLSCLIQKKNELFINFVQADDLYNLKKKHKKKIKASQRPKHTDYEILIQNSYGDIFQETQQDLLFMLRKMTPIAKKQNTQAFDYFQKPIIHSYVFVMQAVYSNMKLIKPSLPDPIIYVNQKKQHYMLAFSIPEKIENNKDMHIKTYEYKLSQNIQKQILNHQQYKQQRYNDYIRLVKYVEEPSIRQILQNNIQFKADFSTNDINKLIIVVWGNRIQLYQYFKAINIDKIQIQGVSMAVLFPFIQLFASVFCIFQTVWGSSN